MIDLKKRREMMPPAPLPTFSIILPTFNREKLVTRAIDSILMQDYRDFELIIVDDGSTDETMEVLWEYCDPRILILQKENGGVSSARNVGLGHARGKYVTFVDSDDYLLQGFLHDANEFLANGEFAGVFYGGFGLDDKEIREFPAFFEKKVMELQCYEEYELFEDFCLRGGNSWACAKFFDRKLICAHQIRFCEDISYGEDLNFILQFLLIAPRMAVKGKSFYCCDMRHESLNRGQIDMDVQSEHLLRNHQKIKDLLIKDARMDLMYCLNSLTISHLGGRYFKKVKQRWRGKGQQSWENEFLKICAQPEQELDFVRWVRRRCFLMKPAILGVLMWSIFNRRGGFKSIFLLLSLL